MDPKTLPARPSLEQYKKQAKTLLKDWKAGDADARQRFQQHHHRLKGASLQGAEEVTLADAQFVISREHGFESWSKFTAHIDLVNRERASAWEQADDAVVRGDVATLERLLRERSELRGPRPSEAVWPNGLSISYASGDAREIVRQSHDFESWDANARFFAEIARKDSAMARFEKAVDAIVGGDLATLQRSLRRHPELIRARSPRRHHSTLLHYAAANGVEGFRQNTPANIVAITGFLLGGGADVNATADMYGGGSTTLGLAATSIHPVRAGVLEPLVACLIDAGARVEQPNDASLVNACLANGRLAGARLRREDHTSAPQS